MPETVAELGVNLILQTGKFFGVLDSTLGKAGQRLTTWGTRLSLAITAPLLGLGTAIAKIGMDYETAFTGVLKSVEEATDAFGNLTTQGEALERLFRDMAMEIPISRNELAKIGAIAGQLGITGVENIGKFVETVAKISVSTDLTVERASFAFARLMSVMGLTIDKLDEMASTVVYLGNEAGATESEIVDLALRMSGSAAIIGMTEQALLGWSAAMRKVEIRAEMGGTAFSTFMIRVYEAVEEGGDALEVFAGIAGITAEEFVRLWEEDVSVALLAFVDGLDKFQEAGGNVFAVLDKLQLGEKRVREVLLKLAASHEEVRHVLGLAAAGWEENIALEREFNLYAKTTASMLKMLWSAITDIAISIFQAFQPAIEGALASLTGFVHGIAMMARESPELLRTIVLVGAAIAAIGPAIVLLGIALKVLAFAIATILSPLGLLIAGFIALAAVAYKFITARFEIESFADAVVVASDLIARALNWIADRLSGLIDFIAQAAEWGASAMAEFAQGIIGAANLVIRAISYIAGIIASLLGPGSPPAILPDLADWGREAINEFLYGMTEADFDILNKVGDIIASHLKSIGFEDEGELADAITRAQLALARVVFEARTAGEASSAAWQELRDAIQDSTGDIERYIRLRMELTQAEEELAAIEQHRTEVMDQLDEERFQMQMRHKEELRAADAKVQAAEEALQKFREETAEIPERFTRGRERQLQTELRAAQKERDSVRERHDIEMTQFEIRRRQIQETLDAQVEAAREARDLLQKQVRWLEELIQTRLDLFESYDAEKGDLEDLSAIFDDMKRNVEDIFPSMEGLAGKFDKAKEAAQGLFDIWKAFWLGITGAPIDEVDVLTGDTVRMWEAGHKLYEAWNKFVGVLGVVAKTLAPIAEAFQRVFTPEGLEELKQSFRDAFGELGSVLGEALIAGWQLFLDFFFAELDTLAQVAWPALQAAFEEFRLALAELGIEWVSLREIIIGLITIVGILLLGWAAFVIGVLTGIAKAVQRFAEGFHTAMTGIGMIIEGIKTVFEGWADVFKGLHEHDFPLVLEGLRAVFEGVWLQIQGMWTTILGIVEMAVGTILGFIEGLVTGVVTFFQNLYERLIGESIIPDLVNGIVEWFGKLPQLLWEKVEEAANRIVTRFNELKDKLIYETIPNMISELIRVASAGLDELAGKFWSFKSDVEFAFNQLRENLANKIQEIIQDALWWFSVMKDLLIGGSIIPDMISDIESAFAAMSANVVGVGEGMVGGLAAGMAGQMPGLRGALAGAGAMGGTMTGLNLTITNYWDASLGSKDRIELEAMMEKITYVALDEMYGGVA